MFEIMAGINDVTTSKDYLKTDALSNAFNMVYQSTLKATNDTVVRNIVDLNKNLLTGQGNTGENIQKMVNNAVLNNFGLYRALFRDLAEILDPYQRQYKGMEEDIKRGIPGARETLKPRYDYFGQPIKATFDTTVLPYPVGVANKNAEDEYQKLMTQNQIRLKAEAAPELKERKESKDVAKSQLRQVYTEGISKPGNVQKATQIIKSNELSQEDVSSIQNEISKQKVIDKLPAEAQPLINFTKDELKTFASISPENKKLVDEFNKLQPKLEFESKIGTNAVDYQLRNLNTVRKGKITIPKVSVKKGKKSKVKKGKVIKLKTPKFSGKPYTLPSPKKVKIPKVSVKKLKKNRTGVARVKVK
jgi:K+/H+ antiporter YhaU regulatory subunit KhtT